MKISPGSLTSHGSPSGRKILTMPPSIARPTVPGFASASSAECQTGMPVSVEPKYSLMTGPHHSIIARLTCGGQGAAPWTMKRSDDRS